MTVWSGKQHSAASWPQPNNETRRLPPADILGVQTLYLRGPGQRLRKNLAKKPRFYGVALQTALGLSPAGHAIDVFFLCLWLAGIILWGSRLRPPLRYPLLRLVGVTIGGVILLSVLQVGNNRLFDRHFPDAKVLNTPSGLDPR